MLADVCDVYHSMLAPDFGMMQRGVRATEDLTVKARSEVLGRVVEFLGFLCDVAAEHPADVVWKLEHDFYAADAKVKVYVKDACRQCEADAAETSVPASYPEFCSPECALDWIDDNGSKLASFDALDQTIADAEEKADAKARADVIMKAKEEAERAAIDVLDGPDNLILDVIRTYGRYARIDQETAARKLEALFRSGRISL